MTLAQFLAYAWAGAKTPPAVDFNGSSRQGDPLSLVANPQRLNALGEVCARSVQAGVWEYVDWFRNSAEAPS